MDRIDKYLIVFENFNGDYLKNNIKIDAWFYFF